MQSANIFTKPISKDEFYCIQKELKMIDHIVWIKGEKFLLIVFVAQINFYGTWLW